MVIRIVAFHPKCDSISSEDLSFESKILMLDAIISDLRHFTDENSRYQLSFCISRREWLQEQFGTTISQASISFFPETALSSVHGVPDSPLEIFSTSPVVPTTIQPIVSLVPTTNISNGASTVLSSGTTTDSEDTWLLFLVLLNLLLTVGLIFELLWRKRKESRFNNSPFYFHFNRVRDNIETLPDDYFY